MKKYRTEFKLEIVQSFLAGEGGAKLLARRWSLPEEKIGTWVSHYRLHGVDGLRHKRSTYSAQFKLQMLSHQDREQLSGRQVAAIYDIRHPNQVAGLACSTFYYQCHATKRRDQQDTMKARIRTIYDEYKGRYGYRRITERCCPIRWRSQ